MTGLRKRLLDAIGPRKVRGVDVTEALARFMEFAARAGQTLGEIATSQELKDRIDRLPTHLGPYGVDPFGFDPNYVKQYAGFVAWMYRYYFRVQTFGIGNVPDGRALIIGNHSGQLPFDGAMINASALLEREPPRYYRAMIERFVPATPFASAFMARSGQVLGTPENAKRLLESGEALMVFPEGVRGLNKSWSKRYQLQRFGHGFMRLALETGTPIVPVVVIGAEEQAPSFVNSRTLGRLFGTPVFPIIAQGIPLPAPTKYRIYYGEPMAFEGDANEEDEIIQRKVDEVREVMQNLITRGLEEREAVFW
ncbi:MAG: lysophospholipid acyltransferase family protein [Myxococcota bacterium]